MTTEPSARRFAAACAASLLVPVLAGAALFGLSGSGITAGIVFLFLIFGLPIALLHLLVLALPAYAVLRHYWPLSWWAASLGGFVVGAIPIGLMSLASSPLSIDPPMIGGLLGLSGGLAFWAVLAMKKGGPSPDRP
ncbi:MAG TPA: hypothetical protein VFW19_11575 [Allosphingosinicella sp.]|nr:hypothetical protein [Allosphingosinicella sp.]